jgi:hypothetical protein
MLNKSISQLMAIALLKRLNHLNAVWEDEIIDSRIDELDKEHIGTQEFQELERQCLELLKTARDTEDEEQRKKALFKLNDIITDITFEAAKFHYIAGFNDAILFFSGA